MAGQKGNTDSRKGRAAGKKRRSGSKKRVALMIAAVALFFILAVIVAGYCIFKIKFYDKTNYVADDADYTVYTTLPPAAQGEESNGADGNAVYATLPPAALEIGEDIHVVDPETAESVSSQISGAVDSVRRFVSTFYDPASGSYGSDEGEQAASHVENILLIGVDRRDKSWYGNSDAMILVSVNYDRNAVYMTSFLRDLSADIPGIGVKKLNAACAHGGPRLLVDTIESNYGIRINNYISVDFEAMIHVVDAVGGIDMDVTDDEAEVCNSYVREMCGLYGGDYESHCFSGGGYLHLDGYQAVAFARNRYTGTTHDFGRADRQRKVLMAIFDKARSGGIGSLSSAAQAVLPYMTHNMDEGTVLSYIARLPSVMNFSVEQSYIPYDDMFHYEGEMMVPDMTETIRRLHSTIY